MPQEDHTSTNRVLFASCNSQHHEQVLWESILSRDPRAFVWGGDAVYADDYAKEATPAMLTELYHQQKQNAGYKKLLDTTIPILGVLDDHDYGVNNGDKTYRYRKESGIALACDFLDQEGTAICERAKKGLGVYGVKVMDFSRPRGQELLSDVEAGLDPDVTIADDGRHPPQLSNKSVAIFLLDVRSNKTPYTNNNFLEKAEYDGDFLGEAQWEWFETALGKSTASVNIVVQGLQLHADRQGPVECWSRFPSSQHRMYQMLLQKHVKAPIVVSGDVHHAQMLRKDCHFVEKGQTSPGARPRMLLEVTTSGLTHSWGSEICARPHQLFLCRLIHSKWAAKRSMELAQWINGAKVWTELLVMSGAEMASHKTDEEGKSGMQFALERNFAEFDFDWDAQSVTIRILGKEVEAAPLLSTKWSFDSLSGGDKLFRPVIVDDKVFVDSYDELQQLGGFNSAQGGQWVCMNYRGAPSPVLRVVGVALPVLVFLFMSFFPFILPFIAILSLYRRFRSRRSKPKQS